MGKAQGCREETNLAHKAKKRWTFKSAMWPGAYGWRSSAKAVARIKSATSEIKAVNRTDPIAAADAVVALAERISPAFESINTSSGALGGAVYRTLEQLIPILIKAPAPELVRAQWLEGLRMAINDDGFDYLEPISERFGEIAAFEHLQNEHADRDLDLVRECFLPDGRFMFHPAKTLTLSCLLEAGRHDELTEMVMQKKRRLWSNLCFVAEARVRQGREDEALELAESLLEGETNYGGTVEILRFCESILIRKGQVEDAYRRFGLPRPTGSTYLAKWRSLVKRYPDIDPRKILTDLMELEGSPGKWFATAKTAGFLDIALHCAGDYDAEPSTLIRAARDFKENEPEFAVEIGIFAIYGLVVGRGYEPETVDINEAVEHIIEASERVGSTDAVKGDLARMTRADFGTDFMKRRLKRALDGLDRTSSV